MGETLISPFTRFDCIGMRFADQTKSGHPVQPHPTPISSSHAHFLTTGGEIIMRPELVHVHSRDIEHSAAEAIAARSNRGVDGISVQEEEAAIVISGTASSFYAAQLALAAVRNLMREQSDGRTLRSAIIVHS